MQDFLTALFIAIPAAFTLLMLVDFVIGLRNLASPLVTSMTVKPDPLVLLPEQTPRVKDSQAKAKVIEKILPDPWTLPTLSTAISAVRVQQTPEPRLLLLPPAVAVAPLPTVQPAKKRRGRPRKAAAA